MLTTRHCRIRPPHTGRAEIDPQQQTRSSSVAIRWDRQTDGQTDGRTDKCTDPATHAMRAVRISYKAYTQRHDVA